MRLFWDERGYKVTENQLADEYSEGVRKGYIDPGITFYQWINNCTDKNGTLTEIKNKKETEK